MIQVILNPTGYMLDIFRFCFHSFEEVHAIDSSKTISNSPEVSNFNRLLLKLDQFIWNYLPDSPDHRFEKVEISVSSLSSG
jgi:hypothetical protein